MQASRRLFERSADVGSTNSRGEGAALHMQGLLIISSHGTAGDYMTVKPQASLGRTALRKKQRQGFDPAAVFLLFILFIPISLRRAIMSQRPSG